MVRDDLISHGIDRIFAEQVRPTVALLVLRSSKPGTGVLTSYFWLLRQLKVCLDTAMGLTLRTSRHLSPLSGPKVA